MSYILSPVQSAKVNCNETGIVLLDREQEFDFQISNQQHQSLNNTVNNAMYGWCTFVCLAGSWNQAPNVFLIYNMKLASARISFYHWLCDIMLGFGREPRDLYHCVGRGSQARTTFHT